MDIEESKKLLKDKLKMQDKKYLEMGLNIKYARSNVWKAIETALEELDKPVYVHLASLQIDNLEKDKRIEELEKENSDLKYETNHGVVSMKLATQAQLIDEKDKRIEELEYGLLDMITQYAEEVKGKIYTTGLSALENAFNIMDFDNGVDADIIQDKYEKAMNKYYAR